MGSGPPEKANIPCNILLLVSTFVLSFKWDQIGRAVCARVTNANMLADLRQILVEEWDAIPQQCDQADDQHEEEVPSWFFHMLLRSLTV